MSQIVITCDEPPVHPLSGNNRKTYELVRALSGEREIHLLVYPDSDDAWHGLTDHWRPFGVLCHRLARRRQGAYGRLLRHGLSMPTVTRDFPAEVRIIRQLAGRQPAVLLIDFISGAPLLKSISGAGTVLSGHDCMSFLFAEEARSATNLKRKVHFLIRRQMALKAERLFAHRAAAVHLVSQQDARELRRVNPRVKPVIIPLGGNEVSSRLRPFRERSVRLIWGSLRSELIRSGLQELFRAAEHASGRPLAGWVLVGRVAPAEAAKAFPQMGRLGIHYIDRVADIGDLLAQARCVLLPDVGGTGQKNRTLDSMGHGCVVFGLPEVFRDIPPGSPPAYIQRNDFDALLKAVETYADEATSARAIAVFREEFSGAALSRRWAQLLDSVGSLATSNGH